MNNVTIGSDVTMADGGQSLLANRYRVMKQLGQGGMGSVWLAEDTVLDNRPVAIKMLPSILFANKRAYNQLKSEALVAMKLSHPNIASVRYFEENDGNPFIVEDYIEGQTLDDYLAERCSVSDASSSATSGGLPRTEVIRLLTPVADALDYAHREGVIHRDVKPANVMIRKDGTPFVLDFGIAREAQEMMTMVTGKLSSGTLMYMSPEQLHGAAPVPAHDIYSFAAMAYECLAGHPPFWRGQIEYQIDNDEPQPLGPHFINCGPVMAGLAKDPADRPATCAAVLASGRVSGSRDATTSKGTNVSQETVKKTSASRVILPLMIVLSGLQFATLVGFFVWWMLGREGSTGAEPGGSAVASEPGGSAQEVASDFVDTQALERAKRQLEDLHNDVETKKKERDELSNKIAEFRVEHAIDELHSKRDTLNLSITKTTADILELEKQIIQLEEWEKCLQDVVKNPQHFASTAAYSPRAQEIADAYNTYQKAIDQHEMLRRTFTDSHPDVIEARNNREAAERSFIDAAQRALTTCTKTLQTKQTEVETLKKDRESLRSQLAENVGKIVRAESGLSKLESELKITEEIYKTLSCNEVELRQELDRQSISVRVQQSTELKQQ